MLSPAPTIYACSFDCFSSPEISFDRVFTSLPPVVGDEVLLRGYDVSVPHMPTKVPSRMAKVVRRRFLYPARDESFDGPILPPKVLVDYIVEEAEDYPQGGGQSA